MDKNHPANVILQLKLDIYFSLTLAQKRKFYLLNGVWHDLDRIPLSVFRRVTKSKKLENDLIKLKQLVGLRLVA